MRTLVAAAVAFLCGAACIGPTTPDGSANKLALHGDVLFASLAGGGVDVFDRDTGTLRVTLPLPEPATRADDLAVEKDALFVLDASEGWLWSYDISEAFAPRLASAPVQVPVGPFSGLDARKDVLVVSGGTSELTVHRIDKAVITGLAASLAIDRGQPDVALLDDAKLAVISTHFDDDHDGAEFGLTALRVDDPSAPRIGGRLGLPGAGFTEGLANPANFPLHVAFKGRDAIVAHGGGVSRVETTDTGEMELRAQLDVGGPATGVTVQGGSAYVITAGDAPRLLELELDSGGLSVRRTFELPADTVPLDVVSGGNTITVAVFGAPLLRFAR